MIKLAGYMNPSTNSFILLPLNGEKLFFFPLHLGWRNLCVMLPSSGEKNGPTFKSSHLMPVA